jgi:hypothetical protein
LLAGKTAFSGWKSRLLVRKTVSPEGKDPLLAGKDRFLAGKGFSQPGKAVCRLGKSFPG